jgi:hypothetical protein
MFFLETPYEELSKHIDKLIKGEVSALLAKGAASLVECERVYHNFISNKGLHSRNDGVPGKMVGANTFLMNKNTMLKTCQDNAYADVLFQGTRHVFQDVYDVIEDTGHRFRRMHIDSVPSPQHRAAIWHSDGVEGKRLLAHTDWPQIRHSTFEFNDVIAPIAVNFYPKHPRKGQSVFRLYKNIPSQAWLNQLHIGQSGFPIPDASIDGHEYVDIFPEEGDILFFNAEYIHTVNEEKVCKNNVDRLNINGFIGFSPTLNRVISWA